ncbi:MAG: LexA repressor [Chlamydiae bacterium]|nr:LexA repressor [Chlamydiota bacterium]
MSLKILGKAFSQTAKLLPYFEARLPAGFPSPADDFLEKQLDLHELLVKHPAATFFVRVEGDSMIGAGIHSGDILVVDRSLSPRIGKIIVALLNGEFTVKRLKKEGKRLFLSPENPRYPAIEVEEEAEFQVWGVVTYVIHRSC